MAMGYDDERPDGESAVPSADGAAVLPLVEASPADPQLTAAYDAVAGARGGVPNVFKALGNSPEAVGAVAGLGTMLRERSVLDPALRESVVLAVAAALGSTYEWSQHHRSARRLGVEPEALVAALATDAADPVVAAARVGCDVACGRRPAARDLAALAHLGPRAITEIAVLGAYYGMLARFLGAWGVPLDEGIAPLDPPDVAR
ncbi:MAG: carboxymuconolactone decarboxylase [Acidimicrobiales bacterium]|nr:carboxymuconolactone decarboxylase [Acidimicrobiales bacterium]